MVWKVGNKNGTKAWDIKLITFIKRWRDDYNFQSHVWNSRDLSIELSGDINIIFWLKIITGIIYAVRASVRHEPCAHASVSLASLRLWGTVCHDHYCMLAPAILFYLALSIVADHSWHYGATNIIVDTIHLIDTDDTVNIIFNCWYRCMLQSDTVPDPSRRENMSKVIRGDLQQEFGSVTGSQPRHGGARSRPTSGQVGS